MKNLSYTHPYAGGRSSNFFEAIKSFWRLRGKQLAAFFHKKDLNYDKQKSKISQSYFEDISWLAKSWAQSTLRNLNFGVV